MGFTTTTVGNGIGVFGVGFNFFSADVTAFVTYGNGTTENIALPFARLSGNLTSFFGLTSDLRICSIAFGLPNGGATENTYLGIDNLIIGAGMAAVPLPAGGVLLVTALGGFGWLRRSKGRQA